MFLVFEGIDGCGKSTQIRMLADYLESQGLQVELFKEPGSTVLGESIRALLLKPARLLKPASRGAETIEPLAELFLFMAARCHLVRHKINPALKRGKVVLCDRFLWSSVAYQGVAGGVGLDVALEIGRLAT